MEWNYLAVSYVIVTLIIIYQQAREKKKLKWLLDKIKESAKEESIKEESKVDTPLSYSDHLLDKIGKKK